MGIENTSGYISLDQAARLTGYSVDQIKELVGTGKLGQLTHDHRDQVRISDIFQYQAQVSESADETLKQSQTPQKRVVSPWMTKAEVKNQRQSVGAKSVQYARKDYSPPRGSKSLLLTKPNDRSLGPRLQLLPAISTLTVSLAIVAFMMSAGSAIYYLSQQEFGQPLTQSYEEPTAIAHVYSANAAASGFIEYLALVWYQTVSSWF